MAICKPRHWNLGIGVGIGTGIGTDTTNAIISNSIRSMDTKPSRMVGWGDPTHKVTDTSTTWSRDKSKTLYLYFHKAYGPQTQQNGDVRWGNLTRKTMWHIDHVVAWQIKIVWSPHSQGPWSSKLGKLQTQDEGALPKKVTWHFNCVIKWKIKNVIFPQPQSLRDVRGKLVLAKNKHKNTN